MKSSFSGFAMSVFQDPLLLINQALAHIIEFEEISVRFFHNNKPTQRIDVDPDTGNKTYKLVFQAQLPDRLRYLCHACITDLRHALDQAACIAFEVVTNTSAPDKLYFPITNHPNDLNGRLTQFFPPELHPVFKRLEAYPTGPSYPGGSDVLCNLSAAAQNKHRLVPKVGGKIISLKGPMIQGIKAIAINMPPRWDFTNNELVLGTTLPDGYFNAEFDFTFYVTMDQAGPFSGRPVTEAIKSAIEAVDRCVTEIRREIILLSS